MPGVALPHELLAGELRRAVGVKRAWQVALHICAALLAVEDVVGADPQHRRVDLARGVGHVLCADRVDGEGAGELLLDLVDAVVRRSVDHEVRLLLADDGQHLLAVGDIYLLVRERDKLAAPHAAQVVPQLATAADQEGAHGRYLPWRKT